MIITQFYKIHRLDLSNIRHSICNKNHDRFFITHSILYLTRKFFLYKLNRIRVSEKAVVIIYVGFQSNQRKNSNQKGGQNE